MQLAKNHPKTTLVLWDWNAEENKKTADAAKKLGAKVCISVKILRICMRRIIHNSLFKQKVFSYQLDITDRLKVEETALKVHKILIYLPYIAILIFP